MLPPPVEITTSTVNPAPLLLMFCTATPLYVLAAPTALPVN